jgi:sugar phosphate isomerase/epimerase
MKTCISTYSYHRLYKNGAFTDFDAIDQTKEFGADGVELLISEDLVPAEKSLEEYVRELTEHARSIGLEVPMYTLEDANLLCKDPEAALSRLCRHVDVASACGIPRLRFDVTFGYPKDYSVKVWQNVVRDTAPYIRRAAEYAEERGVMLCSENHGYLMQDSTRLEGLFAAVDHPNYKWLCDVGNFCCADEDPAAACGRLAPMAIHVHAKDCFIRSGMSYDPGKGWLRTRAGNFVRPTVLGHGDIPVFQSLGVLHRAGYNGFVSIEFEGIEEPSVALQIAMQNLKRMIGDLKP